MSRSFTVLPQRSSGELPSTINGVALNITGTGNIGNVSGVTIGSMSYIPSMFRSNMPIANNGLACSSNGQYIAVWGMIDNWVRVSSNYGVTWALGQQVSAGAYGSPLAMSANGAFLIGGSSISSNYGVTWSSLPAPLAGNNASASCISSDGSVMYFGGGLNSSYVSSNSGVSWTVMNFGVGATAGFRQMLCSSNGAIVLAMTQVQPPLISSNYGSTWAVTSGSGFNGTNSFQHAAMTPDGATILLANVGGFPVISSNTGSTWTTLSNAGSSSWNSAYISSNASLVVIGGFGPGPIKYATGSPVNASSTWTTVSNTNNNWGFIVGSWDGNYLAAVPAGADVYTMAGTVTASTDRGVTWVQRNSSIPRPNPTTNFYGVVTSYDGSSILGGMPVGSDYSTALYFSSNSGETYTFPILSNFGRYAGIDFAAMYAGYSMSANGLYVAYMAGGQFYLSSNRGSTFTAQSAISANLGSAQVTFSSNGLVILAPKNNNGIYFSSNGGSSWSTIASNVSATTYFNSVATSSNGAILLAGGGWNTGAQVYISSNTGSTWSTVSAVGTSTRSWSVAMSYNGARMAVVPAESSTTGNIWISSNSGGTWTRATSAGTTTWQNISMSGDGMKIVAIKGNTANGNVTISVDGGVTWSTVGNSDGPSIFSACISGDGTTVYVGKSGTNALTKIPIRPALENPISTVATISNLTSSNITASGAGSNFTVTGNELVVYNGSSNTSNYGAGHDTLTLRSTAEAYAGGVASLAFANSNTGYPLGRIYAVDTGTVPTGFSSSLVFQSAVSNQLVPAMTITGSNVSTSGTISIQQIQKTLNTIANPGSGTVVANWSTGDVWYVTSLTANFTINLTTLPTTQNKSYLVDFMLVQGATPYYISALQIAGAAQTIKWSGGSAPTPTANRVERETFTLLYTGSAWTVMGQLTSFG